MTRKRWLSFAIITAIRKTPELLSIALDALATSSRPAFGLNAWPSWAESWAAAVAGRRTKHWEELLHLADAPADMVQEALGGLKTLYTELGWTEQLILVLREGVARAAGVDEKATGLGQIVDILEEQGRTTDALSTIDEILTVAGEDVGWLERAADLALQVDDAEREARYMRRLVSVAVDRLDCRLRLARILSDELDQAEEAFAELSIILQQRPGDGMALDAAEDLLSGLGRQNDLLGLLKRQYEQVADQGEKTSILLRMAEAATLVTDGDTDWRAWSLAEMRKLEPERRDIAEMLAQHQEDVGQHREAIETMRWLADCAGSAHERVQLLRRMGSLSEHRLQDYAGAEQAYSELLTTDPDDSGALRALVRICQLRGERSAIPSHVVRLLELEPQAADVIELVPLALDIAEGETPIALAIALLRRQTSGDPLNRLAGYWPDCSRARGLGWFGAGVGRMAGLAQGDGQRGAVDQAGHAVRSSPIWRAQRRAIAMSCACSRPIAWRSTR
jgi:tetratricopeptide (TPR) repeat protein